MYVGLEIGNFKFTYIRNEESGSATEAIDIFQEFMAQVPLDLVEKLASEPVDLNKATEELLDQAESESNEVESNEVESNEGNNDEE